MKFLNSMPQKLSPLLLCVSIIILAACESNFPKEEFYEQPKQAKSSKFTLGSGDYIRVTVYEHNDLSGNYGINDSGQISLPLISQIDAEGKTLSQLEREITRELSRNFIINPKVSIEVITRRPFCILGEVRNPGCFSHVHGMNSAQAVAIAGGYTYRAFKNKFAITREDGRKVAGDASTAIHGGDMLEIFERYF
jgi:protein involved in polysaccharide export with SLBB domain